MRQHYYTAKNPRPVSGPLHVRFSLYSISNRWVAGALQAVQLFYQVDIQPFTACNIKINACSIIKITKKGGTTRKHKNKYLAK